MNFLKTIVVVGIVCVAETGQARTMGTPAGAPTRQDLIGRQPVNPTPSPVLPEQPRDIDRIPKEKVERAPVERVTSEREKRVKHQRQLPVTPKVSMEVYANNHVSVLSRKLIDDIFPKKATIERLVQDFKNEYPGPNKLSDTTILYDAIVNNPEIRKFITLENAVSVHRFIKETMSAEWDRLDEIIWSS